MTIENVIAILGLLGLGGLISGYCTFLWQRKNTELVKMQEFKEARYKCIIILMHSLLDFDRSKTDLQKHGYNISTMEDLKALLRAEHINSFLFASDEFIRDFGDFNLNPTGENLFRVAVSMRKDLWGVKTKLSSIRALKS